MKCAALVFAPALVVALFAGCSGAHLESVEGPGADDDAAAPSEDAGDGADASTNDASTNSDARSSDGDVGTTDATNPGDARVPVPDGASPFPPDSVTVIVEPSDDGGALVSAIQAATKSVHMTMYLLSSTAVINALIAQHAAGRDVKVILNQNFGTDVGDNTAVEAELANAGVDVQWAPSTFALTHEKCVILDATTAWIMTMNATQTSPRDNREYLAVDTRAADVSEAEQIFEADFANSPITPTGDLVVAPVNASTKLVALLTGATATIDMEAEELSDPDIVAALSAAQDRGVAVRVVLSNDTPTKAQQLAIASLKQHDVKLVTLATPYVHAKSVAVDGARAYVGSENFTAASLQTNRELGLVVSDATQVAKVTTTTAADFANGTPL